MSPVKPQQTVGVRLSPEDVQLLRQIAPKGNLSEGVRLLLETARQRDTKPERLEEALARINAVMGDPAAMGGTPRSVVSEDVVREATLILATFMLRGDEASQQARVLVEADLVDRGFDLSDALLRHVLSTKAAALDSDVVRKRANESRELTTAALAALAKAYPAGSR